MASKVDMCNRALTLIGANNITSLSEDSNESRACNVLYSSVRQAVLRDHPWNCVTKQASLARMMETPEFDYEYYYRLPADCLRILKTSGFSKHAVHGKRVASDELTLEIEYIYDTDDPNAYDAALQDAIYLLLASKLAYMFSQSSSQASSIYQLYLNAMSSARGIDAREGTAVTQRQTSWLRAHIGGNGLDSTKFTVE